jgi:hypothetical protein
MATPVVDPLSIAGLSAWYKIDSVVSTDGSTVATWADSSGNGFDLTQGTDSSRPTYQTNEINSTLACLRFDGTDDVLLNAAAGFDVPQPFTTLMVLRQIAWADGQWIWDSQTASEGGLVQEPSGASPNLELWGGTAFTATNAQLTIGTWGIVTTVHNGASSSIRVDHAAADATPTTGDIGTSGIENGLRLASKINATNFANFDVAEWLIYGSALSAGDQNNLRRYLSLKYGITVV